MTYGIRIRGAHGEVQIDNAFRNLHLVAKGTATSGTTPVGLGFATVVNIPQITSTAVVATGGGNASMVAFIDTATKNVTFYHHSASASFDWYVFDQLSAPSTATYGLRVRQPVTGAIAFDSGAAPMRVLGVQPLDLFGVTPGSHGAVVTLGTFPGKKVAAAIMNHAYGVVAGPESGQGATPNYVYSGTFRQTNEYAYAVATRFAVFNAGANYNFARVGYYLLLDVTGL